MTKTVQSWLDTNYKNKNGVVKIELHDWNTGVDSEELTGELVIDGYINAEEIIVERWEKGKDGKSKGKITKANISNCPKLKKLGLDNNEIKEIVFKDKLPNLTELHLAENQLTRIDISNLPALSFLNLPRNSITEIKGLEYATSLHMINLLGNPGFNGHQYGEWKDAIKDILGIPLTDPLPNTWKNDLKVKLDGLKNPPASNPAVPITKEQWDNDYSKRPTEKEFKKVKELHDAIVRGARDKIGDDWKRVLEIEQYYNQIEQSR